MMFRLLTASLLEAMRSTDYTAPFISQRSAVIGAFRSFIVPLFRQVVTTSVANLLLMCFFDCGHPHFRNFNSAIPVNVIIVKSYVDSFLDPMCVPVRVSIIHFITTCIKSTEIYKHDPSQCTTIKVT